MIFLQAEIHSSISAPIPTSSSTAVSDGSRIRQQLGQISPAVKHGCSHESMTKSGGGVATSSVSDEKLEFDIVRKIMNPNSRPFPGLARTASM